MLSILIVLTTDDRCETGNCSSSADGFSARIPVHMILKSAFCRCLVLGMKLDFSATTPPFCRGLKPVVAESMYWMTSKLLHYREHEIIQLREFHFNQKIQWAWKQILLGALSPNLTSWHPRSKAVSRDFQPLLIQKV